MLLHYLVKKKQVAAERLLRTQMTFSQSVMVSVGVLKLGVTDLIFVDPGAKVNCIVECGKFVSSSSAVNNCIVSNRGPMAVQIPLYSTIHIYTTVPSFLLVSGA